MVFLYYRTLYFHYASNCESFREEDIMCSISLQKYLTRDSFFFFFMKHIVGQVLHKTYLEKC